MTKSEKAKHLRLQKIYKSSLAENKEKLEEQGNGCAICSKPFPKYRSFQDHLHACCPRRMKEFCGKCNRGILCYICNKFVVGYLEMKKIPIQQLYDYIMKWDKLLREKGCYEPKPEAEGKSKKGKAKSRRK